MRAPPPKNGKIKDFDFSFSAFFCNFLNTVVALNGKSQLEPEVS